MPRNRLTPCEMAQKLIRIDANPLRTAETCAENSQSRKEFWREVLACLRLSYPAGSINATYGLDL